MKNFRCTLPWMINDKYELCQIIDTNRNQSYAEIVSLWNDNFLLNEKHCPKMPKCKQSIYRMDLSTVDRTLSLLTIQLKDSNILTIVDNYSYDFQSFIGEVGGTLGLFLGFSMFSFVEFIEYLLRKLFSTNIY